MTAPARSADVAAEASEAISFEVLSDPAGVPRARAMLQRAEWAARAFARYDKQAVDRVVHAAAQAGAAQAREYAEWAVRETGFGVADHKVVKNLACSTGLVGAYATHDYVTPRFDPAAKLVEIPRPAGVVLALTPSTNPVASVFFKALLALMTRNAVIISPHPQAAECCADAARTLGRAAVAAGAPDGVIQVVDRPSVPLIDALMTDERTSVIVATGGSPVVRAAYSSGTPAIGVGPGNVPVLVDATADLAKAAKRIVESKSFDNSILCTNESVLIVEDSAAATLLRHLKREGAHLLEPDEAAKVAALLFPGGHFDVRFVGKDPAQIAAGRPAGTRYHPDPAGSVLPRGSRGAARAREALPRPRPGPGAERAPRHRRGPRGTPDRRARALGGDPQHRSGNDHGFRGQRGRPAGLRQRRQQPGQFGDFHGPGTVDDRGDGVLRAVVADREPGAEASRAVDPDGLQRRGRRGHGELLRADSLGKAGRAGTAVPDRFECWSG